MSLANNPLVVEEITPEFEKVWAGLTDESRLVLLAGHNDGPAGFEAFFKLVFKEELLPHAKEWIETIYRAKRENKGTVIQAFRGSAKTTTLTIAFTAFRIGHDPYKSNLLIQVGDDIAADNSQAIAGIIDNNPGWAKVFPHVVPDKEKGWGKQGYEVKRDDIPYDEWRQQNTSRKDATLLGVGYKSHAIIGKRPTGFLIVDDIHDEINTQSERELIKVEKILTGTILPTITPDSWVVFVGTPWLERDSLHYMLNTGEMIGIETPIMRDGKSVWESRFSLQEIQRIKNRVGEIEYARMFMLDLDMAKGVHLKGEWLHKFPREKIEASWPIVFGVDYASTQDKLKDKERDYFSLSIWRQVPGGGAVLIGGYKKHLSQGEAEEFVKAQAAVYPTLRMIGIENIGKGEEFYSLLLRNTILPLRPVAHGKKGKGERFEKQMAPMFYSGRAWIIDVPNVEHSHYIKEFREEWLLWPMAANDDCLDAAYMGMVCLQYAFMTTPEKSNELAMKQKNKANPFSGL